MTKKIMRSMQYDQDVEVLSHEIPYQGYFRMEKYKLKHKLFNGAWGPPIEREVFERGKAIAILLFDPKLDQVVLIEQFRIGALQDKRSPWLLEIVAGILEPGETPEEVCIREAKEEAGLEVQVLFPIFNYLVSPGGCTEETYLFCGIVDASKAGGVHGVDNENEDIKVHVFNTEDALQMLHMGEINTPPAIIALMWLEQRKMSFVEE